jgi:sugar phosphate isomerase/epimerase
MSVQDKAAAPVRYAAALFPWAGPGDRFLRAGYRPGLPVAERIRRAAGLGVLDGVEIVYPAEVTAETAVEVGRCLRDSGLALCSLGTSITSQPQFGRGALTARDPAVRREAVSRVKSGLDICGELGGDRIFFFLGQDGCDYPLEVDYQDAWGWMIEGLQEIAAHRSDIQICLEYKPNEPRRHIFLSNAGTALHLVTSVGQPHVGVLFDTGHAFMAQENLGESVFLLAQAERLFHVHFNDNYGKWDDDMVVGSIHLMPFVEAVYWLKRVGYDGWRSLDLFPFREDPDVAVLQSIRFIQRVDTLIDEIGMDTMADLIRQNDGAIATRELSLRLLGVV